MTGNNNMKTKLKFKEYYLFLLFSVICIMPYALLTNELILSCIFFISASAFTYYIIKRSNRISINNLEIAAIVLIILSAGLSIYKSTDRILSMVDSTYILICIITYVYIKSNLDLEKYIIKSIILGAGIYSIVSIITNISNPYNRLEGLFNYANSTAIFLALSSILYFFNYEWLSNEKYGKVFDIINLITISALFATESRGGILIYLFALIIGKKKLLNHKINMNVLGLVLAVLIINKLMLAYFLICPILIYFVIFIDLRTVKKIKNNIKTFRVIKSGLIIVGFIFIIYSYFNRLLELSFTNSQLQERLVFISDGLNMLKKNILGVGAGQYNKLQFLYQSANYDVKYVHNGYVQIGLDYGLIALLVFGLILILLAYEVIRNRRFNQWLVVIVMILMHSVFDFTLSFISIGIILMISIALLHPKEDIEIKNITLTRNVLRYLYTPIMIVTLIFIIAALPYEMIYSYANFKEQIGTRTAYNYLKTMDKYPVKDNRYYMKMAGIEFERYDETDQKELVKDSIYNFNKYISLEKYDARAFENLSVLYFKLGDLDKGEKLLKNIIDVRPLYPKSYSKLADLYYYNIKTAVNKRDLNAIKKNLADFDYIQDKIKVAKKSSNYKTKYMNDQLKDSIDSDHQQVFSDVEIIRKNYANISK